MTKELITIGEITRHQGNKGEVRVKALTDFTNRFEELEEVFLIKGRNKFKAEIEEIRHHKGFVIVKFVDCDDIGTAIEYKGYQIKIPLEQTKELGTDEYYLYQIQGLEVYTTAGEYLGEITDILETGANDVYVVKQGAEELLIPAIKEVVHEVNLEDNRMQVELLTGLR
ncbi:ribosome maturation factor RimM [Halanaerobaculum tunisiense]